MKKTLLATIICVLTAVGAAFGQNAVSMSFNDNNGAATSGTYNSTDTFSLDVFLTANFTSNGLSYWLETQTLNGFNMALSITNITYLNFTDPKDNGFPKAFTDSIGASTGFKTDTDTVNNPQTGTMDPGDLGATGASHGPGTFQIATITFSLNGAAAGTYILRSTTVNPKISEVNEGFNDNPFSSAQYTIIMPEPSTFALLGLAAAGLGVAAFRRRGAFRS